ncbi:MAG TPA: FkbM family methyltransferase [Abditibacteriaceae bacterium]|nr:FkbM family methyltransferase [Abditibacteriaceae bacterium]
MNQKITSEDGETKVDPELTRMLSVTRRLPPLKILQPIPKWMKRRYLRRPRQMLVTDVLGFKMCLNPQEYVDSLILFAPQLYDPGEISFLKRRLKNGDVFLDIGAHIGFYSLHASGAVGPEGTVIAIEAAPKTFKRLQQNVELNGMTNVRCLNLGVSDKRETLRLNVNPGANQGSNSFRRNYAQGVDVECLPLLEVLREQGIKTVAGAKLDIEGFEYPVLSRFFNDADQSRYPKFVVIELNWKYYPKDARKTLELLRAKGYQVHRASKSNYLMVRP